MTVEPCLVPPAISPVPDGLRRPLWSVKIPTFNCASYLRQTLESVLEQDPGPEQMEIEVVDDCSTKDDPESVVREVGRGRVSFYRKPRNEGATANFNTCIERSHGQLVHILHGDDYLLPGFYSEILKLRTRFPQASLFGCRLFGVDETGILLWISSRIGELESGGFSAASFYYASELQFCSVVIQRDFFSEYGGFLPCLVHTADCEMWARAISHGGGIVSNKVLANYRIFSTNDTGRLMQTGENIRDRERLNDCLAARFPDFDRVRAREIVARMALNQARQFRDSGNESAAEANFRIHRELKPSVSFPTKLRRIVRLLRQELSQCKY